MTTAYFSNCLPVRISVNLNQTLDSIIIPPRSLDTDNNVTQLNMCEFPVTAQPSPDSFSNKGLNRVHIKIDGTPNPGLYDIQVYENLPEQDLFFFVFERTLVGYDTEGHATGISIQVYHAVQRVIQTGVEPVALSVPVLEPDPSD